VKPIERSLPSVDKPTSQPIQRTIVGPPSPYSSAAKSIAKSGLPTKSPFELELAEVNRAWRRYRSIKDRDAVYIYLASVFGIVMRWRQLNCALKKSRMALHLKLNPPQMKAEPFGIVIFCTSEPEIVDAKTRSKWSRVLRYARKTKPPEMRLMEFIKSYGGLNACARLLARNRKICL
jgi:hypothetical protein